MTLSRTHAGSQLRIPTPLGTLLALAHGDALGGVYFEDQADVPRPAAPPAADGATAPVLLALANQLEDYLAGRRVRFDLPLAMTGTPFQCAVWEHLHACPHGTTLTYGSLAAAIGRPRAVRAVGQAVGRNPWVIVVPCHRVLAAGGRLGGFSSGLTRKRALLRLEGVDWREP